MHMTPEDVSPHLFVPTTGHEFVKTGVLRVTAVLIDESGIHDRSGLPG